MNEYFDAHAWIKLKKEFIGMAHEYLGQSFAGGVDWQVEYLLRNIKQDLYAVENYRLKSRLLYGKLLVELIRWDDDTSYYWIVPVWAVMPETRGGYAEAYVPKHEGIVVKESKRMYDIIREWNNALDEYGHVPKILPLDEDETPEWPDPSSFEYTWENFEKQVTSFWIRFYDDCF